MKSIRRAGMAIGLAAVSGVASATPCESALSSYESFVSSGQSTFASEILSNHPECFAGGATNSLNQINGTSFQHVTAISQAIALRFASDGPGPRAAAGLRGMAAGSPAKKWNGWGNLGQNDTRQSYTTVNGNNSRTESDIFNGVLGADYSLSPAMVLGVSLAFDSGDIKGTNSASVDVNRIGSRGRALAPYFGMQITKELVFDASVGIGRGTLSSNTGTETETDRWFAAANLGYERWMGNLQFAGKASLLRGVEKYDDSKDLEDGTTFLRTGAKNTLDQLRLNAQASYWMNGFMPYAALGYTEDLDRKTTQFGATVDPIGKGAWVWAIGANFIDVAHGITGGIAYRQEESRSNQRNKSITANVGIRF